jgi:hypothetical protein
VNHGDEGGNDRDIPTRTIGKSSLCSAHDSELGPVGEPRARSPTLEVVYISPHPYIVWYGEKSLENILSFLYFLSIIRYSPRKAP